jgi:hypothetical protein
LPFLTDIKKISVTDTLLYFFHLLHGKKTQKCFFWQKTFHQKAFSCHFTKKNCFLVKTKKKHFFRVIRASGLQNKTLTRHPFPFFFWSRSLVLVLYWHIGPLYLSLFLVFGLGLCLCFCFFLVLVSVLWSSSIVYALFRFAVVLSCCLCLVLYHIVTNHLHSSLSCLWYFLFLYLLLVSLYDLAFVVTLSCALLLSCLSLISRIEYQIHSCLSCCCLASSSFVCFA